jgi:predicted house-cleaning noncanonical NTP pyrophosphatase (MazG superfamily)
MKANNILNRILAELSSIREVKFEQMTLENGAVLEAEVFEAGNEVFVISGEDRVPAPVGEHLLSDGRVLVITEEGLIAEIKEAAAEEVEEKIEVEVEASAEEATELAEVEVKEEMPAVAAIVEKVLEEIAMMREEMKAMREEMGSYAKKEEMASVKAELSAAPAAKPIKHNPEKKQVNKVEFNRPAKAIDRVLARLNN